MNCNLKVTYNKETHIYRGQQTIEDLVSYIFYTYNGLSKGNYTLTYLDEENDEITVSCSQDLEALISSTKSPKLTINAVQQQQQPQSQKSQKTSRLTQEQKEMRLKVNKEKVLEKRKQMKEQREKKMKEFFQTCKKDKQLSKMMTNFQKKFKEFQPKIEEFLKEDFTYQGSSDNESEEEESKDEQPNFVKGFPLIFNQFKNMFPMFGQFGGCQMFQQGFKPQQNCQQGEVIHRGYVCDGCNKRPIKGIRYHCTECPDFDFCSDCIQKNVSHQHSLEKFEKIDKFIPPFQQFLKRKQQQKKQEQKPREQSKEKTPKEKSTKISPSKAPKQETQKPQTQPKKPIYGPLVIKLAKQVSEVLGQDEKVYYGVCKHYKNDTIDYIIEEIIQSPGLLEVFATQDN